VPSFAQIVNLTQREPGMVSPQLCLLLKQRVYFVLHFRSLDVLETTIKSRLPILAKFRIEERAERPVRYDRRQVAIKDDIRLLIREEPRGEDNISQLLFS